MALLGPDAGPVARFWWGLRGWAGWPMWTSGAARACGSPRRSSGDWRTGASPHRTLACDDFRGRATDGADVPEAAGRSDRARAMSLPTAPGWLRLRLKTWVALATANGQAREWVGDERRRKTEHGGVGKPHSRGASGTVIGSGADEPSSASSRLQGFEISKYTRKCRLGGRRS